MTRFFLNVRRTLEMIKFSHSVFALPFALLGALLAARGWPHWWQLGWIVVAMVGARSAAMTFNRIVDRRFDALNPRTRNRALVAGTLSTGFAWGFFAVSAAVLIFAAARLNPLAFKLSPLALAWVMFYSYTKRFTALSHLVLGVALGIAPAAAYIAVRGTLALSILPLTLAVTLWVAGFDILYACQDLEFDRTQSALHSLPKRLGLPGALLAARLCHLATVAALIWLLQLNGLGTLAWVGLALVASLLLFEHLLVKETDLSRLPLAFAINGYVGILLLLTWGTAVVARI